MVKLFFDGGARPNPGPIETAVVCRGAEHVRRAQAAGDNNAAEWLALIHAAEVAVAAGIDEPLFCGDSAHVIALASGARPCRRDHDRICLERFRALAAGFRRVRIRKVPRAQNLAGIVLDRRFGAQS